LKKKEKKRKIEKTKRKKRCSDDIKGWEQAGKCVKMKKTKQA